MSSHKQIRRNLLFNIISLLANIIIGILYTPYLVKNLGIIAYGIVPLALIINQYITVITGSLTGSLTRFYTISVQKGNIKDAEKYLNTSLGVISLVILLLILPSYFFVKNIDILFNIPDSLLESTKYLFSFTLISFSLSLFSSILNISLYAYNRLDLLNIIKIVRVIFKFLLITLLFNLVNIDLLYVGLANFFSEVIVLFFSIFCFYFFNNNKIKLSFFKIEKSIFYVLISMALWVMIQQIGDTMLYRIDSIFINKYWSTKETGIIGAFTELGTYAISISAVIGSLFGPLILQSYSKEDHEEVIKMTLDSSLVVGILVAIMIGIICGFAPILINIWLGKDFLNYNYWLYAKLFLIPFYASAGVFAFTTRAWNKVRYPAIFTVILGFINILTVYFLAENLNKNENSILIILTVCLVFGLIQSYFLNGYIFSNIYSGNFTTVVFNAFKILVIVIGVFLICNYINVLIIDFNIIYNIFIILLLSIALTLVSFKLMLTKEQIKSVISLIYKK